MTHSDDVGDLDTRIEALARELRAFARKRWPSPASRLGMESALALDPEMEEALDRLLERWKTPQANVVFAGEVSSGKSTLINAVVGEEGLLPIDSKACTATWAEVHYSPNFTARATVRIPGRDEVVEEVPRDELGTYLTVAGGKKLVKKFGRGAVVKGVSIGLPSPELAGGLWLYDTPGAGGLKDAHIDAARAGLINADAVAFLFRPGKPPSQTERRFLAEAAGRVAAVITLYSRLDAEADPANMIKASRCLQDQTEWEKILGNPEEAARMVRLFGAEPLLVSARNWLQALSKPEGAERQLLQKVSNMDDLLRELHDVVDQADLIHRQNIVHYSGLIASGIEAEASHRVALLHGQQEALEEQRRREERIKAWTENGGDRWRSGFDGVCGNLREEFKEKAKKRSDELSLRYRAEFDNMKRDELNAELERVGDQPEQLLAELIDLAGSELRAELRRLSGLVEADLGKAYLAAAGFTEPTDTLSKPERAEVRTPVNWVDVSYAIGGAAAASVATTALTAGTAVAVLLPFAWPLLLGAAVFGGRNWYQRRKARHVKEARDYLKAVQDQLTGEVVKVAIVITDHSTATVKDQVERRLNRVAARIKADAAAVSDLPSTDPQAVERYEQALTQILDESGRLVVAAGKLEDELGPKPSHGWDDDGGPN
jgi:hypothetical protein